MSEDEYWWDDSKEEIHFRKSNSLFRVSRIAIADCFELPDKREAVTENFVAHWSWFRAKARELLSQDPDQKEFLIDSDVLQKFLN